MRDRSIDEFEALFEQAAIPVLRIEDVPLTRIAVVVKGHALDESVLALAAYLCERFGSEVEVLRAAAAHRETTEAFARRYGFPLASEPFHSTAELVGRIAIGRSQLVLLPEPPEEAARFVDLDQLVTGTKPPILVVRTKIAEPGSVFVRILHCLTGNFRQTQNFSYSFTLVTDDGFLQLLHVVVGDELRDVREALRLTAPGDAVDQDAFLQQLTHHGERYLKAVVAAARDEPFDVRYRLAVGDVVKTVEEELRRERYGLLVVGRHEEGHSRVSAEDYRLMHQVQSLPVLAL